MVFLFTSNSLVIPAQNLHKQNLQKLQLYFRIFTLSVHYYLYHIIFILFYLITSKFRVQYWITFFFISWAQQSDSLFFQLPNYLSNFIIIFIRTAPFTILKHLVQLITVGLLITVHH